MRKSFAWTAAVALVAAACGTSGEPASPSTALESPETPAVTAAEAEASEPAPTLSPDEVAVRVNTHSLSRAEFDTHLDDWAAAMEGQAPTRTETGFDAMFVAFVATQFIQLETIIDTIMESGIEMTNAARAAGVETVESQLAQLPKDSKVYDRLVEVQSWIEASRPQETEIAAYFQSNVASFGQIMCTSHILHETEAAARDSLTRLEGGEDFAALAREVSTGPSGPTGGDLGCVGEGSFVPEFEAAVLSATDPDQIIGPVESQFGFHVIQVHSVAAAELDDVRDEIVDLLSQRINDAFFSRLATADIEVALDLGTWDAASQQVIPPG